MIRLAYRPPYDWVAMSSFLAKRAIPGVESSDERHYERAIAIDGAPGLIRVKPDRHGLMATYPAALRPHRSEIAARLEKMFDLGADSDAIAAHLSRDRLLAPLVKKRPGLRVPGAWDPFEIAIRAIVGQQVSVAAARGVLTKMTARYGRTLLDGHMLFPDAAALAEATELPMPARRAATIRRLAAAVSGGDIALDSSMSVEDCMRQLRAIEGIGPWTASYIAMRALGDRDAFPSGDLILRRAAGNLSATMLEKRAEAWRPWRAYAVLHLWAG